MAASKPVEAAGGGGGGAGLSRWQLALVLGAPILLGAGALYLWGRRAARRGGGGGKGANERKTPEGRASPGPCGGGGSGQPDGPGHEEMVSARPAAVGADPLPAPRARRPLVPAAVGRGSGRRRGRRSAGFNGRDTSKWRPRPPRTRVREGSHTGAASPWRAAWSRRQVGPVVTGERSSRGSRLRLTACAPPRCRLCFGLGA